MQASLGCSFCRSRRSVEVGCSEVMLIKLGESPAVLWLAALCAGLRQGQCRVSGEPLARSPSSQHRTFRKAIAGASQSKRKKQPYRLVPPKTQANKPPAALGQATGFLRVTPRRRPGKPGFLPSAWLLPATSSRLVLTKHCSPLIPSPGKAAHTHPMTSAEAPLLGSARAGEGCSLALSPSRPTHQRGAPGRQDPQPRAWDQDGGPGQAGR